MRGSGTVKIWNRDNTAHLYQLKVCLYVPGLKYSLICEDVLYLNDFCRKSIRGDMQTPFIECMKPGPTFKAVTEKNKKLNALPYWVFYHHRRTPGNWREMRDSTRVLASRPYLPFEVRQNKIMPEPASPTSDQVDVASMERLQHLASRPVED